MPNNKPNDPVKAFMESNGFEQTLYGNYSGHDMMFSSEQATFIYNLVKRREVEARVIELKNLDMTDMIDQCWIAMAKKRDARIKQLTQGDNDE